MIKEIKINKLVGVDQDGSYIFVEKLHWNGVSVNHMVAMNGQDIEDRVLNTDPDDYKDLWVESVNNGHTEESLVDWFEELQTNCDGYFLGHDDSYASDISKEDWKLVEAHRDEMIETFECIGCGTGDFSAIHFAHIFDQELLDRCLAHEKAIEAVPCADRLRELNSTDV